MPTKEELPHLEGWRPLEPDEPTVQGDIIYPWYNTQGYLNGHKNREIDGAPKMNQWPHLMGKSYNQLANHQLNAHFYPYRPLGGAAYQRPRRPMNKHFSEPLPLP